MSLDQQDLVETLELVEETKNKTKQRGTKRRTRES